MMTIHKFNCWGGFFPTCVEKTSLVDLSLTVPLEHLFLHLRHCSHLHWWKTNDFLYEATRNLRNHSCHFEQTGTHNSGNSICFTARAVFPRYPKKSAAAWPNDVCAHVAEKANTWILNPYIFDYMENYLLSPLKHPMSGDQNGLVFHWLCSHGSFASAFVVLSRPHPRLSRGEHVTDLRSRSFRCIRMHLV